MEKRTIPSGILVLAGLAFVAGFWRVLQSCYALWGSSRLVLVGGLADSPAAVSIGFDLLCLGMFGMLLAIAWLVVADSLFNLRSWAWQLALILATLNILFSGLEMVVSILDRARGDFPSSAVVALAINGLVVWYLLRGDVRGAFEGSSASEAEPPPVED